MLRVLGTNPLGKDEKAIFEQIDTDHDGKVSFSELAGLFPNPNPNPNPTPTPTPNPNPNPNPSPNTRALTLTLVNEIMGARSTTPLTASARSWRARETTAPAQG